MLQNDILERLRKGEDAENIAQELINSLNEAIAERDEEIKKAEAVRKAEEEARKAAAEKEQRLNLLVAGIANAMKSYYKENGVDDEDLLNAITNETVKEQLDAAIKLVKSLDRLSEAAKRLANEMQTEQRPRSAKRTIDDVFEDFFTKNNI